MADIVVFLLLLNDNDLNTSSNSANTPPQVYWNALDCTGVPGDSVEDNAEIVVNISTCSIDKNDVLWIYLHDQSMVPLSIHMELWLCPSAPFQSLALKRYTSAQPTRKYHSGASAFFEIDEL